MVHLGIIPDGNRRWCKKVNLDTTKLIDHWLYEMLLKFINEIINESKTFDDQKKNRINQNVEDLTFQEIYHETNRIQNLKNEYRPLSDITELSIYISSIDNLSRDDNSIDIGYEFIRRIDLIFNNVEGLLNIKIDPKKLEIILSKIKLNIVGDIEKIPDWVKNILKKYNNNTNQKYTINFAMAYDYNNDISGKYIRDQSNIDIVFRSGGEMRLSGFFPTKVLYSELYFCKKLWPDITINDIRECLNEYYRRNRRFGK